MIYCRGTTWNVPSQRADVGLGSLPLHPLMAARYSWGNGYPTTHVNSTQVFRRYLKGTKDMGLHIKYCENLTLQSFSDADYAYNSDDRRSTAGYCVFFGDSLVSWSSEKQHVVSCSIVESEYRALALVACELA
ncbi:hypothetical protein UlMin_037902 [Ulmus minor]